VAELRQGREAEARRHWQQALKHNLGLELARENLSDLSLPIGERNASWPFDFGSWASRELITDLKRQVGTKQRESALTNGIRRFLQKHPDITALIPILLDRGDPHARQFALMIARTAQTPELLAALRDFASSQRGPDEMRHLAAQAADAAGLFPDRKIRMWMRGEWHDILLMGFEISDAPEAPFSPAVTSLMIQATQALHADQGPKAERLLNEALELEPDSSPLRNNLAMAYSLQGRHDEAEALVRSIHERDPDYLFGRVAVARMHIRDGEYAAAEELLKPLMLRRRLHLSEATAYFGAQVDLYQAQSNTEAARTWLEMWERIDPDNADLDRRRLAIETGGRLGRMRGRH
jgi:tetratricopeptide (TPR) repeat protein